MINSFLLGNTVRLQFNAVGPTGALLDVDTPTVSIRCPDETVVPDISPVRDSLGSYHYDYVPTMPGIYHYRFYASSPISVAGEDSFNVTKSEVV